MKWTKQKPDRPGWWWRRTLFYGDMMIEPTKIIDAEAQGLAAVNDDVGMFITLDGFEEHITWWSDEPIEEPTD